jgi:hypothetical protein
MKPQKRKGSCTSKREIPLEIQERIYLLSSGYVALTLFDLLRYEYQMAK